MARTEKREGNFDLGRRKLMIGLGMAAVAFPLGCNRWPYETKGKETSEEKTAMIQGDPTAQKSIPPLDASAPSRLEKATFALG